MLKDSLGLAKEFAVRSYDSIVASASVAVLRCMMLERQEGGGGSPLPRGLLFFGYGEAGDISLKESLQRLFSCVKNFFHERILYTKDCLDDLLMQFFSGLPSDLRHLIGFLMCEMLRYNNSIDTPAQSLYNSYDFCPNYADERGIDMLW